MSSRRYQLVFSNRFVRDLRRLDHQVRQRVLEAIEKLQDNPYIGEKVAAQETGAWRLRVGDWRVRYDIVEDQVHLQPVDNHRPSLREPQGTGYVSSFSSFRGAPTCRGMGGSLENSRSARPELVEGWFPSAKLRVNSRLTMSGFSSFGVQAQATCAIA